MKLRKVCLEDKDLILDWRNRKEVRTFMYTSREISYQEHANWFGKMICDKTKCWTIL